MDLGGTATAFGLRVLIPMLGPVSAAHFKPALSIANWFLGRRAGTGPRSLWTSAVTGGRERRRHREAMDESDGAGHGELDAVLDGQGPAP